MVALVLLVLLALPPIRVILSPRACFVPCEVAATVIIPAHEDNRQASLVWEAGSSSWSLTPTSSPERTIQVVLDAPGTHTIYAVLLRKDRKGQMRTYESSGRVEVAGQ